MVSTVIRKFDFLSNQAAMSQRLTNTSPQQRQSSSTGKEIKDGRSNVIREQLKGQGFSEPVTEIVVNSWRKGTRKQYGLAWNKWYLWCFIRGLNPFSTSENIVLMYLHFLMKEGKSYSVLNTHKSMLLQTLIFFDNKWCKNPFLLSKFMKGLYNLNPPAPKYSFTWNVSKVLNFLCSLVPLSELSLKLLTFKLTALIALSTAARAQTLEALSLDLMRVMDEKVVFLFKDLLKTSKQGKSFSLELRHYDNENICVMHTLLEYIDRTKSCRKSRKLLVSYCSFKAVCSSTIARWLKSVLEQFGIDTSVFKAHSFRSASVSAALFHGCSIKEILKTADWSSAKNFYKFYFRDTGVQNLNFAQAVLSGT